MKPDGRTSHLQRPMTAGTARRASGAGENGAETGADNRAGRRTRSMDVTPMDTSLTSAELQDRWFVQSSGGGWIFAGDWHEPAVEALCEACVCGDNLWPAAERLGSARAEAGVSLGETLADVDGLTTVLPGLPASAASRGLAGLGRSDDGSRAKCAGSTDRPGFDRLPADPVRRGLSGRRGCRPPRFRPTRHWLSSGWTSPAGPGGTGSLR